MVESKITAKGQTTLPKAVREALSVQPGDRVRYVIREGEVLILPVRPIRKAVRHTEARWAGAEPGTDGPGNR